MLGASYFGSGHAWQVLAIEFIIADHSTPPVRLSKTYLSGAEKEPGLLLPLGCRRDTPPRPHVISLFSHTDEVNHCGGD